MSRLSVARPQGTAAPGPVARRPRAGHRDRGPGRVLGPARRDSVQLVIWSPPGRAGAVTRPGRALRARPTRPGVLRTVTVRGP
jgi:hypothetical protein